MSWFPGASVLVGGAENVNLLADTTVPTISAAAINAAGNRLTVTFSEIVNNPAGFTITASGGAVTLTNVDNAGVVGTFVFSLSRTIQNGETVTVTYTPGIARDNANNALAAVSGGSVTNSATSTTTTTTTTSTTTTTTTT